MDVPATITTESGTDANRDARTASERPEDTEGRPNAREALKASAQGRIATKRETEGREFSHVPGGTWLNQSQEEYLRRPRGNLGKEKRRFITENPQTV
ncbi:hypothetical protein NDU88_002654 [Pleurodeles waltl]|uniref:Uncharacterized protein n=1 Tax=Pleurodeles waltl TaxID=8319 RepID=A0AAV7MNA0_PLEWA|nr:hypothetical protein NDU88_002654 [Pleurodeles waltl]